MGSLAKGVTGIHVGSDPLALIPIEKLREQLEVNLISPLVVTQVS